MTTEENTMTAGQPYGDAEEAQLAAEIAQSAKQRKAQSHRIGVQAGQRVRSTDIDLLAAELDRVQEAFDRAKPVLDAARTWRHRRLDHDAIHALLTALDAYDTAQKAPETALESTLSQDLHPRDRRPKVIGRCPTTRHTLTRPSLDESCTFDEGHSTPHSFELPEPAPGPLADPCPHCGPGYRYGDDGCRHEPAEVDHPDADADTAEPPTWLTEAIEVAARVWYNLNRPNGKDWFATASPAQLGETLAKAEAAVRAAAPIIRRQAEQERDELFDALQGWHQRADALRAQLADARRATLNEAADAIPYGNVLSANTSMLAVQRWLRERAKGGSE